MDKPGAANRAFEILRALLKAARQWGDIGKHVPGACANIARNPSRPVARYLDHSELERLGDVLDRHQEKHPRPVAAIRLLTLTGARLSEVGNLKWRELGEVGDGGARARLENTKTGAPTVWLGPEATSLLASLPRTQDGERVFPGNLTSDRPYTFWVGIRDKASLPGLRIHDCRHTWASQGIMNGVGLTPVGRLLGHRKRETTAIYAHLDDGALQLAAAQAAAIIARAMGYRSKPVTFLEGTQQWDNDAGNAGESTRPNEPSSVDVLVKPDNPTQPHELPVNRNRGTPPELAIPDRGAELPAKLPDIDWL